MIRFDSLNGTYWHVQRRIYPSSYPSRAEETENFGKYSEHVGENSGASWKWLLQSSSCTTDAEITREALKSGANALRLDTLPRASFFPSYSRYTIAFRSFSLLVSSMLFDHRQHRDFSHFHPRVRCSLEVTRRERTIGRCTNLWDLNCHRILDDLPELALCHVKAIMSPWLWGLGDKRGGRTGGIWNT